MANVKLKDWNGIDVIYSGIEKISVETDTGETAVFTHGEVGEDITADADFSAGDMVLSHADGKLMRAATVKKPENLLPENIAKGIEIAGVVGEFAGGGVENGITYDEFNSSGQLTKATIHGKLITPFYKQTALTTVEGIENLTEIIAYAFDGCTQLEISSLPTSLISIGERAFYSTKIKPGRYELTNVQTIGNSAFNLVTLMGEIIIDFGTSINSMIGSSALSFSGNYPIHIIIRNTTMIPDQTSQYNYIAKNSNTHLYVPRDLVDTWKNSNYMKLYHSSYVYAIEDYPDICG